MRKSIIFTLLLFGFMSLQAIAQEEKNVEAVIASLFEGMKSKDASLVENAFHKDALMHTVQSGEDASSLGSNSVRDFINRIATTPANTILDERILEYQIKIDGDMASAWTPYEFYVNEGFSHCGVNSFQLIKTSEGWKITYVIDTRRKIGCRSN
ncbi:nuclear transport factor 2 family protein [Mongoliibacter ruber]|uniref:Putative lumazine-binding protein n=1 Tax=Mongoliibacter ruber TaxID=1750599 RepID=A0A2T0WHK0_9BACT|nr:nuclear transport factor 2 family protein [Mongoliibacter ruber]PRY86188.1 putative lumazine-binding protein [Mongoliibacter ruber]